MRRVGKSDNVIKKRNPSILLLLQKSINVYFYFVWLKIKSTFIRSVFFINILGNIINNFLYFKVGFKFYHISIFLH